MATAQVNGTEIVYDDLNPSRDSRPPVVLVTGLSGIGRSWGEVIERLAATRRVVVPDHRGTGRNAPDLAGQTIAQHASDLVELIRQLDCGPAHFVGSSTGGAFGQVVGLESPESLASLSLLATWARADAYFTRWFRLRREILLNHPFETHIDLTHLLLYSPSYWAAHHEQLDHKRDSVLGRGFDREIAARRMEMLLEHDVLDRLPELRVPTLVVAGGYDPVCPPHLVEELHKAIPGSRYELFENSGHLMYAEDPERFDRMIHEFIDDHDAAA